MPVQKGKLKTPLMKFTGPKPDPTASPPDPPHAHTVRWARDLKNLFGVSDDGGLTSDIHQLGVRIGQHDRDFLLSILKRLKGT